ncbi:unnamed protein product, partial [Discosporangium mesarthrocarpum]
MLVSRLSPDDEFVVLACDGLFDVFSNDEVVEMIREELLKHGDTQRACEYLTERAISERYTRDNVSVVLVVLNKWCWAMPRSSVLVTRAAAAAVVGAAGV